MTLNRASLAESPPWQRPQRGSIRTVPFRGSCKKIKHQHIHVEINSSALPRIVQLVQYSMVRFKSLSCSLNYSCFRIEYLKRDWFSQIWSDHKRKTNLLYSMRRTIRLSQNLKTGLTGEVGIEIVQEDYELWKRLFSNCTPILFIRKYMTICKTKERFI